MILAAFCIKALCASSMLAQNRDYYPISYDIEPDSGYNALLGKYVMMSMRDDPPELYSDSLYCLFSRESFAKEVYYLCDPVNYTSSNILYEHVSRWIEDLRNLLYYCPDVDAKYMIADSLLSLNNDIGILALWESCDFKKLSNYKLYRDYLIKAEKVYMLGDLVIILHNAGNQEECRRLLKIIRQSDKSFYLFLKKLIKESITISYADYWYDSGDFFIEK